jgi:hypothetical protein
MHNTHDVPASPGICTNLDWAFTDPSVCAGLSITLSFILDCPEPGRAWLAGSERQTRVAYGGAIAATPWGVGVTAGRSLNSGWDGALPCGGQMLRSVLPRV